MTERQDLSLTMLTRSEKLATYLEALAKALRGGAIEIESGNQKLLMKPEGEIDFYLKAYRRGIRNKISFDLRWTNRPDTMLELNIKEPSAKEDHE